MATTADTAAPSGPTPTAKQRLLASLTCDLLNARGPARLVIHCFRSLELDGAERQLNNSATASKARGCWKCRLQTYVKRAYVRHRLLWPCLLAGGLAMLWKLRSLIDASGLRPTEIRLQYARVQEIHLWRYLIYWMGSHPFEVARSEHVKELVFTHDGELAIDAPGGASA